ncbi:MAG: DUF1801 domain-containing protein [Gammaproteobacteria bacterium]|nr:DUF1801 domain-containing protein [Gammaproteobacteria bacterium]
MTNIEARLRFDGALPRDPQVDAWFAERTDSLGMIARTWFAQMRDCGEDVVELVHDGGPVACVEDVPFAYVNAFTKHVNVGFFRGAFFPDPAALLQGTGKRMRHVKLFPGTDVDAGALAALIQAAYREAREFVAAEG